MIEAKNFVPVAVLLLLGIWFLYSGLEEAPNPDARIVVSIGIILIIVGLLALIAVSLKWVCAMPFFC